MLTHPAGQQVDDRIVGIDAASAGHSNQSAGEFHDGFVVLLGRSQDSGTIRSRRARAFVHPLRPLPLPMFT